MTDIHEEQKKIATGVTDGNKKDAALRLSRRTLEINLVFLKNIKPFKGQESLVSDCIAMTEECILLIDKASGDV